mmetsp:Transcript_17941/g.35956  ORF Transcript_17941/g.35956 Transcript_17941/m.35956 type:complete len:139 (+) Transcript_17941:220-636(+)
MSKDASTVREDDEEVCLKFIFANLDGTTLTSSFPSSAPISAVKASLIESWPFPPTAPPPDRLRLISMGRPLQPDSSAVGSFNLPKFEGVGTPVNCSVRPEGVKGQEVKQKQQGGGRGGQRGREEVQVESRCLSFCTVL